MECGLCDELLMSIFVRLPPRSTTVLSLVSKRFLRLSRSSLDHLSLNLSPITPFSLPSFLSNFPFLTSLSVSASSPDLILSAAATCTHLKRLRVLSGTPVDGSLLVCVSRLCPKVVSLSVSVLRGFEIECLLFFKELREVSISFSRGSTRLGSGVGNADLGLTRLGSGVGNRNLDSTQFGSGVGNADLGLTQFGSGVGNADLDSTRFGSGVGNADFDSGRFDMGVENPNLDSTQLNSSFGNSNLVLTQFNSSVENPDFVSGQLNLSRENRNFNPAQLNSGIQNSNFSSALFNSSHENPNLNSVIFGSSRENSNFGSRLRNRSSSSTQFNSRSKGPNFDAELQLETLTLSCIRNDDYGLNWLYRSCKKLRKLQFRACEGIGDDPSGSSFIGCIKNVQEVELRTCRMIIDEVLFQVAKNSKLLKSLLVYDGGCREGLLRFIERSECDLQKLDLRLPLDLDNRHLFAVAEKFRGLKSLRLQSCCLVTGEGLKAVCSGTRDGLEELALINCDVAEREPGLLATLGQNLKGLKKLDLSYNEAMVDKEFVLMIISCGDLRDLKLRGCRGLSNLALASISKYCKSIECVDIMYCCGIEAKDVELFVRNSPRLRHLKVEDDKQSDEVKTRDSNLFR